MADHELNLNLEVKSDPEEADFEHQNESQHENGWRRLKREKNVLAWLNDYERNITTYAVDEIYMKVQTHIKRP